MFVSSHMVLVNQAGLPTTVNINSLDYPELMLTGQYVEATEEPMTKIKAKELEQQLISELSDTE